MFESFLQPCILEPTRIVHGHRPTLIDNIFTNAINKYIVSGNLYNKISDHMPNFIIAENVATAHCKVNRKVRDSKNANAEQYALDIQQIDISHILNISNNIDEITDEYNKQHMEVMDKHYPYRILSRKEMSWKLKPWITKEIQNEIALRKS